MTDAQHRDSEQAARPVMGERELLIRLVQRHYDELSDEERVAAERVPGIDAWVFERRGLAHQRLRDVLGRGPLAGVADSVRLGEGWSREWVENNRVVDEAISVEITIDGTSFRAEREDSDSPWHFSDLDGDERIVERLAARYALAVATLVTALDAALDEAIPIPRGRFQRRDRR